MVSAKRFTFAYSKCISFEYGICFCHFHFFLSLSYTHSFSLSLFHALSPCLFPLLSWFISSDLCIYFHPLFTFYSPPSVSLSSILNVCVLPLPRDSGHCFVFCLFLLHDPPPKPLVAFPSFLAFNTFSGLSALLLLQILWDIAHAIEHIFESCLVLRAYSANLFRFVHTSTFRNLYLGFCPRLSTLFLSYVSYLFHVCMLNRTYKYKRNMKYRKEDLNKHDKVWMNFLFI